jgi:hypothetical protein
MQNVSLILFNQKYIDLTLTNTMHKSTLLLFAALLLRTTLPAQCWQKINAGAMQVGDLQTIRIASKMLASVRVLGQRL